MSQIKLIILDVDGVMTTGQLPYTHDGQTGKSFFVLDGGALHLWQKSGGQAAILSGRNSQAVEIRAKDLDISIVVQGVRDKLPAYRTICGQVGVTDEEVCVIGDGLLDLALMQCCGYPIAVANALAHVKRAARYVTRHPGGLGAIAEAIDRLLRYNQRFSNRMEPIEK